MKTKKALACLSILVLLAVGAFLLSCGGSGGNSTTKHVIVADSTNVRVLVYSAPLSTDQSASVVLGQSSLTATTTGTSATTMTGPYAVWMDAVGDLWVGDDAINCRVLEFKPPFTSGMAASVVLGKPDFTTAGGTCDTGPTASNLSETTGITTDKSGNLWVSDFEFNRVLEFQPPFTNGMAASLVLGQAAFTDGTSCEDVSSTAICSPRQLRFDTSGNLWVSDGYNRILEFKPPFTNNMAASLVLGQADFTSSDSGTSATTLYQPMGIEFDSTGNLWVVDFYNNRVLQFRTPFSNGMAASLVLGQSDFTSNSAGTTSASFSYPTAVAFDSSGSLLVTERNNNRTLIFTPPFSNGMAATTVLGQADFTHGDSNQNGSASAQTQSEPYGVITVTN